MKPLPPRAQELVSALEREQSVAERLFGRRREEVSILTALASCAEPGLVPHLLQYVFCDDRTVARAAAGTLDQSLAAALPDELLELDHICRAWWPYALQTADRWHGLNPVEVSRFSTLGDVEHSVIGVASFHSSGYVRQAAVTRLDALGGGRELPFLLIRLNDWVERVAEHARIAVERRVAPVYAGAFLESLPILTRLEISERRKHRDLLDQVYALLQAPEQRAVLGRGLTATDRAIRRTTFRLARGAPGADRPNLLRQALRDADTLIRLEAVADARGELSADELASVLPAIAGDPYPPIRREAVSAAAERLTGRADGWLVSSLEDPNKAVREVARFYLRRSGQLSDFATHYREQLRRAESPHQLATALAGLGETGTVADVPLVISYLEHERPAVRRASVRALASLDLATQLPRIVEMLRDPAPGVSHTVRRILRPRAGRVALRMLTSVLRTASYTHSRFDAVAVGVALGKWESLTMLLEAAADGHEPLRAAARSWLSAWVAKQNQSFAQPTPSQIEAIHTALDAYHLVIDPAVASELRSILRYWAK